MMSDRDTVVSTVLAGTPWAGWQRRSITGDASARRYLRLSSGQESVIVMDAPPETCTDTARFVEIADMLRQQGLAAPRVHLCDLPRGVLVISDLGSIDFAAHLESRPQDEHRLYAAATDLLLALRNATPPDHLIRLTPAVGAGMIGILCPHYTDNDVSGLQSVLESSLIRYAPSPDTLALRDFHAENLIWRGSRDGHSRIGLLDFQDAFVAPDGYDLASLLRDARRDVTPEVSDAMIDRFIKGHGGDVAAVRQQIAVLGVQRNLRILGVFARLAGDGGKTRYLAFLDRVWRHILTDLSVGGLADLREAVLATVPAPTPAHLGSLQT